MWWNANTKCWAENFEKSGYEILQTGAMRCENTHTHIHTQPASYIELDIDLTLSLSVCVWEYSQSYTGSLFRFISQKVFSIQLFEERFNWEIAPYSLVIDGNTLCNEADKMCRHTNWYGAMALWRWSGDWKRLNEKNLISFNKVMLPFSNWIRKQQTMSYFMLQRRYIHTSKLENNQRLRAQVSEHAARHSARANDGIVSFHCYFLWQI